MQIRNITINNKMSDNEFFLTDAYYLSGSKVFDVIDVWVFKNKMGKPEALRIGASFKQDFNQQVSVIQHLFDEFKESFVLNQINTNRLPFNETSKNVAKKFVDSICEAEELDKNSLDFFMDTIYSENTNIKEKQSEIISNNEKGIDNMKLFVVVEPIYSFPKSVYTGAFELGINFFHSCADEKVCGFSLNKTVQFFHTFNDAKKDIELSALIVMTVPIKSALRDIEKAIIELDISNGKIQRFVNIYQLEFSINDMKWNKKEITSHDLTLNALEQINFKYLNDSIALAYMSNDEISQSKNQIKPT